MALWLQQLLGVGFLALGMVSVSSYTGGLFGWRLEFFYKELEPMQRRWGKVPGSILHFAGYTLPPLGFGLIFLFGIVSFH